MKTGNGFCSNDDSDDDDNNNDDGCGDDDGDDYDEANDDAIICINPNTPAVAWCFLANINIYFSSTWPGRFTGTAAVGTWKASTAAGVISPPLVW